MRESHYVNFASSHATSHFCLKELLGQRIFLLCVEMLWDYSPLSQVIIKLQLLREHSPCKLMLLA